MLTGSAQAGGFAELVGTRLTIAGFPASAASTSVMVSVASHRPATKA
jgi:hypothetical protein